MMLAFLLSISGTASANDCDGVEAITGSFPGIRRVYGFDVDKNGLESLGLEERPWLDPVVAEAAPLADAAGDLPPPPQVILAPHPNAPKPTPVALPASVDSARRDTIVLKVTVMRDGIVRDPIPAGTAIDLETSDGPITVLTSAGAEAIIGSNINDNYTQWSFEAELPVDVAERLEDLPILSVATFVVDVGAELDISRTKAAKLQRVLRCLNGS